MRQAGSFLPLSTEQHDPLLRADGVKFWLVTAAVLIAVSAATLHSPFVSRNNAASVFVALAAAFDWHVRAHNRLTLIDNVLPDLVLDWDYGSRCCPCRCLCETRLTRTDMACWA